MNGTLVRETGASVCMRFVGWKRIALVGLGNKVKSYRTGGHCVQLQPLLYPAIQGLLQAENRS